MDFPRSLLLWVIHHHSKTRGGRWVGKAGVNLWPWVEGDTQDSPSQIPHSIINTHGARAAPTEGFTLAAGKAWRLSTLALGKQTWGGWWDRHICQKKLQVLKQKVVTPVWVVVGRARGRIWQVLSLAAQCTRKEGTQWLLLEIVHVIYLLQIHQNIALCSYRMLLNEKPHEQMDALLFYNLIHGSSVNTDLANDFCL